MYLIIAYHGKGKREVEEDLKKLWFNYSNFVKHVKVKHMYFFQNAKDDLGADLLMIIDYKCKYAKNCFKDSVGTEHCSVPTCGALKQTPYHKGTGHGFASKDKSVNYWLYVRDKGQESRDKKKTSSMPLGS